MSGAEVRHCVNAIYKMYGRVFRECDMRVVFETLKQYPSADADIPLLLPTSIPKNPK